jgi:hypothetical protein
MRLPRVLSGSILAAILGSVPLSAQQASSDVGMGVFPFLVGNMDGQVAQIVSNCDQRGIDTIYVSVFRATGRLAGDLWITDRAGDWDTTRGPVRPGGAGIDLVSLIQQAHARNMRVVGVMKCFADTVQPTDAAHQQYLLDVVDYFLDSFQPSGEPTYDLDGIALDYVRFVGSGTGNDPSLVTAFVRDVKQRLGALSLHAYLIANRYTFDGPTYDGNFTSYASVIASLSSQYGQNWEQMARHVDVMMPMCYTADGSIYSTYALHQAYVRQSASYCRTACTRVGQPGRRVQPVVKTYSSTGETTTQQTVDASITGALLGGANGYQGFRYGTMQASWWASMAQHAVPGANFPRPILTAQLQGVTSSLDAGASTDREQAAGTLTARYDTNGDGVFDTPWLPNQPRSSVLPSPVGAVVGLQIADADGHISATRRRIPDGRVITATPSFVRASTGGAVDLAIDGGPGAAGATYLVLASQTLPGPGTVWTPTLTLPLTVDAFTLAMIGVAQTPALQNGIGVLDAQGRAAARFQVPAGVLSPFVLQRIYWSVAAADAQGQPWFVGDATIIVVLP